MNELQIFNFEGREVRTITLDEEPWFCLKDICDILGLSNASMIANRLDADEVTKFDLGSQVGITNFVNESGMYAVVIRSDKPQAHYLRRWITSEILPSIRKHGGYLTDKKIEDVLSDPDTLIRLATDLKNERKKAKHLEMLNSQLTVENNIMAPKAEYFDDLVDRNGLTNFRDTAKLLGVQQTEFIDWLINHKYIYRDTNDKIRPFARYDHKYFEMKEQINQKTDWKGVQTYVTVKGREHFNQLINRGN